MEVDWDAASPSCGSAARWHSPQFQRATSVASSTVSVSGSRTPDDHHPAERQLAVLPVSSFLRHCAWRAEARRSPCSVSVCLTHASTGSSGVSTAGERGSSGIGWRPDSVLSRSGRKARPAGGRDQDVAGPDSCLNAGIAASPAMERLRVALAGAAAAPIAHYRNIASGFSRRRRTSPRNIAASAP